ncbi:hypothetical protein [Hymenobacter bucti]|uniref:Phage tail protein n=1 Tax=Hymenobacter bucti TaxID=1844114 RepID=A0ABW4QSE6_9BACT
MHLNLVDTNSEVIDAWHHLFADVPQVTVSHGSIFDHPADALVSPANSFAAPTMRTPMTITRGPNVYQAMKAILVLLRYGKMTTGELISDKIQRVAIPGLGTGIGQVRPLVCARQMRLAWEDVMHEKFATETG